MSKTIRVDQEVRDYLRSQARSFETVGAVVSRLLNVTGRKPVTLKKAGVPDDGTWIAR
jgi:negative regulator of replication initiation